MTILAGGRERAGAWSQSYDYTQAGLVTKMTQLTVSRTSTVVDYRYTFSDTQNDGRITQWQELVSGKTVQYQYDSLKRLTSAATTGRPPTSLPARSGS